MTLTPDEFAEEQGITLTDTQRWFLNSVAAGYIATIYGGRRAGRKSFAELAQKYEEHIKSSFDPDKD